MGYQLMLLRKGRGGEEEQWANNTTPSGDTLKDHLEGSRFFLTKHTLTKMGKCLLKPDDSLGTLTFRKRKTIATEC